MSEIMTINPWLQVRFTDREGTEKTGPLGLLWQLIEVYEVDIFEVSLSRITNDFILWLQQNEVPLDDRTDFAAMAARLIYYKSKMLLPNPGFEENQEPDSLPLELVEQLLEYKRFQQASELLRELEEKSKLSFSPENRWNEYEEGLDYLHVDLLSFLKSFQGFLQRVEREKPMQIEEESVTIEEMMDYLITTLEKLSAFSFFEIISNFSQIKMIVCFLAILELIRLRTIRVSQSALMDDIQVELVSNAKPIDLEIINETQD
ncbi:MAG: segregation/condensation protein A [Leptospiraceae bacterium]|nr:segregation/condensation protein A [Leptospiraceae bacterium]